MNKMPDSLEPVVSPFCRYCGAATTYVLRRDKVTDGPACARCQATKKIVEEANAKRIVECLCGGILDWKVHPTTETRAVAYCKLCETHYSADLSLKLYHSFFSG